MLSSAMAACGIGSTLPDGDKWVYEAEYMAGQSDCPGCNPGGPKAIGVPASSMNGNAMNARNNPGAWERWVNFSEGW